MGGSINMVYELEEEEQDVEEEELTVELSFRAIKVSVNRRNQSSKGTVLKKITGDFPAGGIRQELTWWKLVVNEEGRKALHIAAPKQEHQVWPDVWRTAMFKRTPFAWNDAQRAAIFKDLDKLLPIEAECKEEMLPPDDFSPEDLVLTDYDIEETDSHVTVHIHFAPKHFQMLDTWTTYENAFSAAVEERSVKVYMNLWSRTGIFEGELGGPCVPTLTTWWVGHMREAREKSTYHPALAFMFTKAELGM